MLLIKNSLNHKIKEEKQRNPRVIPYRLIDVITNSSTVTAAPNNLNLGAFSICYSGHLGQKNLVLVLSTHSIATYDL